MSPCYGRQQVTKSEFGTASSIFRLDEETFVVSHGAMHSGLVSTWVGLLGKVHAYLQETGMVLFASHATGWRYSFS
jgi:hypothetical protein